MKTLREMLKSGEKILSEAGIDDSSFDAFQLILKVSGFSKEEYFFKNSQIASVREEEEYSQYLTRRCSREPLQYILGKWDFFDSEFYVGEGVLIPRPETEELVEHAIKLIKENNYKIVYDLCTGSGCVGLSIAKECPETECYLFDLYDNALKYTHINQKSLSLENVKIIKHDVLSGAFDDIPDADIIVSNPPYIESKIINSLQEEVLKEPVSALDGGDDGLIFYRNFALNWFRKLSTKGAVAVECGENQGNSIINIFSDDLNCKIYFDSYGIDRFVIGKKLQ